MNVNNKLIKMTVLAYFDDSDQLLFCCTIHGNEKILESNLQGDKVWYDMSMSAMLALAM